MFPNIPLAFHCMLSGFMLVVYLQSLCKCACIVLYIWQFIVGLFTKHTLITDHLVCCWDICVFLYLSMFVIMFGLICEIATCILKVVFPFFLSGFHICQMVNKIPNIWYEIIQGYKYQINTVECLNYKSWFIFLS